MIPQVRVVHGKEPAHFLAMFQGKLVVYEGGKVGQAGDEGPNETHLLQVRGTSQYNCKAEQVRLSGVAPEWFKKEGDQI